MTLQAFLFCHLYIKVITMNSVKYSIDAYHRYISRATFCRFLSGTQISQHGDCHNVIFSRFPNYFLPLPLVFPHVSPSVSTVSFGVSSGSPQCLLFPILDFTVITTIVLQCIKQARCSKMTIDIFDFMKHLTIKQLSHVASCNIGKIFPLFSYFTILQQMRNSENISHITVVTAPYHLKFFKGCFPQISLGPFLSLCTLYNHMAQ